MIIRNEINASRHLFFSVKTAEDMGVSSGFIVAVTEYLSSRRGLPIFVEHQELYKHMSDAFQRFIYLVFAREGQDIYNGFNR